MRADFEASRKKVASVRALYARANEQKRAAESEAAASVDAVRKEARGEKAAIKAKARKRIEVRLSCVVWSGHFVDFADGTIRWQFPRLFFISFCHPLPPPHFLWQELERKLKAARAELDVAQGEQAERESRLSAVEARLADEEAAVAALEAERRALKAALDAARQVETGDGAVQGKGAAGEGSASERAEDDQAHDDG